MIDQQYKAQIIKELQKENKKLKEQIQVWKDQYRKIWKENRIIKAQIRK